MSTPVSSAAWRSRRAAWGLLPIILAVLAAGSAKVWWPAESPDHPAIKVLGQKFTATGTNKTNSGCGVGNGGSSKPECNPNAGHQLDVTGEVLGSLIPGGTAILRVSVKNMNNQSVQLTSVDATVGTPTTNATPTHDGCLVGWFTVDDFAGSQPIGKNNTGDVDLELRMSNEATNQDDCKSANIPLTFTATVTG